MMMNGRIIFDVMILAASGWAFSVAQSFPESFMQEHIGSSFFPSTVSALLVLLMLNVLWGDFRQLRSQQQEQTDGIELSEKLDKRSVLGAISVFALLILYVILIGIIGFRFATMLFLFAAMMVCHLTLSADEIITPSKGYIFISAVASILITVLIHAIFVHGFGLSLF